MATFAARRLQPMIANTARIVAIEALAAAQGIEFLRPLRSSPPLEAAHALLREHVPAMPEDRVIAPDIEAATALVAGGALAQVLRSLSPTGPATATPRPFPPLLES
jgi:histidine ammonia-lyase